MRVSVCVGDLEQLEEHKTTQIYHRARVRERQSAKRRKGSGERATLESLENSYGIWRRRGQSWGTVAVINLRHLTFGWQCDGPMD